MRDGDRHQKDAKVILPLNVWISLSGVMKLQLVECISICTYSKKGIGVAEDKHGHLTVKWLIVII